MTGPRHSARRHPPKLYPSLPSGSARRPRREVRQRARPAALGTHPIHPQKILMLLDFLQKSRMVSRHRNAASKKNARCHRMQFFDTRSIARRLCWSRCWQRPARLPQRGPVSPAMGPVPTRLPSPVARRMAEHRCCEEAEATSRAPVLGPDAQKSVGCDALRASHPKPRTWSRRGYRRLRSRPQWAH